MSEFTVSELKDNEMVFGGMLTIDNAVAVRGVLLEGLGRRRQIKITVSEDAVVDVSFLQILCSLHRAAITAGKTVTRGGFSAAFVSVIANAGFARNSGCAAGGKNICLWTIGGKK